MITRRSVSISLGAALASLTVQAQERSVSPEPGARAGSQPTFDDLTRRPIVYSVPGMADVRVSEGHVYKSVAGAPLRFDLYAPVGASRPSPAVILVHGGPIPSLGARRWGIFESYGRLLAATGMIGITFDHRFLGPDRLADSATDLADLVVHVRAHAASFGIDENRLALWTFSGGGALLATALRERSSWWRLLVAYYGVMEPLGNVGSAYDERLSAIAALRGDASNAPPIVLARAGKDDPAIQSTIDRFLAAANSSGATVDLFTHPRGHHGFDILDADDRSREIIRLTLAAVKDSLGVGAPRMSR